MAHIDIGQNSVLNLYSDVEIADGLQVAFSSPEQQYNYFNKRRTKQYTDMSYVYRNGVVKIQDTPQAVAKANYISFNNPSFESKPIYARIVDYQYVNNATVRIVYAVDWFQTFMFDVDYRSCQIMREHLSEADWTKAVANPWDSSIMEMNTSEDFSFSESQRTKINVNEDTYYKIVPDSSIDCYVCLALSPFSYEKTADDADPDTAHTVEDDFYSWCEGFDDDVEDFIAKDDFNGLLIRGNSDNAAIDGIADPVNMYFFKLGATYSQRWSKSGMWGGKPANRLVGVLDDLTAMSRTSQIVSIYYLPKSVVRAYVGDSLTEKNFITVDNVATRCTGGTNPKLKRFPFSYLSVESPSGNRKEYHYEEFAAASRGIDFYLMGMMNGTPYLSLVPFNYRYGNPGTISTAHDKNCFNLTERLDYVEIPQLPYTTDGFLTYMSGLYQQAQQNQSTPTQLAHMGELVGGALTVAKSLGGTLAGGLMPKSMPIDASGLQKAVSSKMGDMAAGGDNMMGAAAGMAAIGHALASQVNDANIIEAMGGNTFLGSPAYDYHTEKALYDNDIYHPGTAGGFPAYRLARFYYQFFFVTLNDAWTELVDTYFNAFGYRSGRIGVPRIVNFIKGSGDNPHFTTYDGAPTTYVQTTDARVVSTMQPVSQYIQNMLNAGCRFINGNGR